MKRSLVLWSALVGTLVCALQAHADIGTGTPKLRGCPHKQATHVESEWIDPGAAQVCAKSIKLADGSTWSPSCPENRAIVPAHGECQGESNQGTLCVPNGVLNVQVGECTCDPIVHIGQWVTAGCTCTQFTNAGTIEDFTTVPCDG
ncbi:MAG: hypothetical protein IT453_15445 [Planctomycetes bacterium]|nr:hypothetical protein [Planctomycetota bacterium]